MFFSVWAMIITFRLIYLMLPAFTHFLGAHGAQFLVATLIIASGFLAHEFKKKDQLMYGRVEICFGISSAIALSFSISPIDMHLTQWASLLGAAYVIARGRNNAHDAMRTLIASRRQSPFGESDDEIPNLF